MSTHPQAPGPDGPAPQAAAVPPVAWPIEPPPGASLESPVEPPQDGAFNAAFAELLRRAPGPIFPRARALYFRKYALEGQGQGGPFRTHLLAEQVEEVEGLAPAGYRVRALEFAVVYRDGAPGAADPDFAGYLAERWSLQAPDLTPEPDLWFRGEGHYARFSAGALHRSAT